MLYQPIVNLNDGSLLGFEALVRWQHSLKGWQSPASFIPFAEETGLIHDMGRWILWEAARRCKQWSAKRCASKPEAESFGEVTLRDCRWPTWLISRDRRVPHEFRRSL